MSQKLKATHSQRARRAFRTWFVVLLVAVTICEYGGSVKLSASDDHETAPAQLRATADQLRSQWTNASLQVAIQKYKEESAQWQFRGDWSRAAAALAEAAEVYFSIGEYRHALDHYEEATKLSQHAKDTQAESIYLAHAGRVNSILGDTARAEEYVTRSLAFHVRSDGGSVPQDVKRAFGEVLVCAGEVYFSIGDLIRASDYLERSERLLSETGDLEGVAKSQLFLGFAAVTMGETERAVTFFKNALETFREIGNRSGEALSITAFGMAQTFRGRDEAAIKHHRHARDIFRVIGDRQSEAITINGIAQAYQNLNDPQLALQHYQEALKIFQESGSVDFAVSGLCQIGAIYKSIKDYEQAHSYYEQCATASREAGKDRILAYAMNDIAALYASQSRQQEALDRYTKLLKFYNNVKDPRGQLLTLSNIGDWYLTWGKKEKALETNTRALAISKQAGEKGLEISALYSLARAERASGILDSALAHVKESIDIIEGLRSNVSSPNLRSTYFAGQRKHYELYIDVLMRLHEVQPEKGYVATALLASEDARARSLREMLAELGTDIRQGIDERTLRRERELQRLLSAEAQNQPELSGQAASNHKTDTDLEFLRAEYEELQSTIRSRNPNYEHLLQPPALTIAEIQSLLSDGNTLLLEYVIGEEQSYLWAVTNDSLKAYKLPRKAELEPVAQDFYNAITARQRRDGDLNTAYQDRIEAADKQLQKEAAELSQMLIAPVADQLGNKRLLIVPEGVLQYIPFEVLPDPSSPESHNMAERPLLTSNHEIVRLPSVSTLVAIRADRRPRNEHPKLVAVFADPVFTATDDRLKFGDTTENGKSIIAEYLPGAYDDKYRSGLMRLKYTSDEAAAIEKAAGSATRVVSGFDATRERVLREKLSDFRIVHFATHGLINAKRPELSGIVLTMVGPDGSAQDGYLQLHDIYRLNLSADLTVLSACNTALGLDIAGEGLIGLTRGFMYAGSRSVVASLWEVDDRATAVLMEHFYKAMLTDGMTPAAALRSAKETVRKQPAWSHPYYWAGFVLQGEYRETIKAPSANSRTGSMWLILAAVVIASGLLLLMLKWRTRLSSKHG